MKVTNIVSGRKIEIHRAIYNSQFDFYFGVNNDGFRYKYLDTATGNVVITAFPKALNAEQYGIDYNTRCHESVYTSIGALRTEAGIYYRRASGQRNPNRLEGFPHLELSDATFEAVPTTDNPTNFVCVVIDGQLYTTDLCASSDYRTSEYQLFGVGFAAQEIRLHDNYRHEYLNQIRRSDNELVVGDLRGRTTIFENEEVARRYGDAPSLGGYHQTTRSNSILNDESVEWFVGFEVEKEDQEMRNRCAWANSNLGNGWVVERDSSLDHRTGFEVVSPVFNLLDTKTMFDEFDRLDWVMNSGHSRRCGGHITISRRGVTAVELIDKLSPFIPLLFSLYEGRLSTDYGGIQNKDEMKRGSRKAIYNCNFGTLPKDAVELRIFSAVSTLESIKFRTKLVQWIVKHIDNGTFTSFTEVAEAMFTDKKLNKLLRSQYSAEKLARKQALVYVFGGCLEGQSPTEFLANSDNYDRTLERMKRAYASVRNFTSRAVESKFGSYTIRKAIGQA
jgi:hypothetical protein